MMNASKKLLILGAGVGGLSVVHELAASGLNLSDVEITVVDEDFSHFLGFTLPWVMRGWRDPASVPIVPTTAALDLVRTVTGTAAQISPQARTVTLTSGIELPYDALIIATGARNALGRVPGLQEAIDRRDAVHYYSADAAADAHHQLREFRGGKLVFLVTSLPYRCPVAPYEGAMLAADLLHDTGTRDATQISVYSPEAQPMPSAGPYAGPELVTMLAGADIAFFGEHAVDHIDAKQRVIHFDNGATAAEYDLLVFVPPHEPALTLSEPGWIEVDAQTMQTRHAGIFAIGDTTKVTSPSGRPLPKAAIFAKNGAKAAATNALHFLGVTDANDSLSGQGYCYIDVGGGNSAQGKGDFFALPHPAIHLAAPSAQLHGQKRDEERDWRAVWEQTTAPKCPLTTG